MSKQDPIIGVMEDEIQAIIDRMNDGGLDPEIAQRRLLKLCGLCIGTRSERKNQTRKIREVVTAIGLSINEQAPT